MQSLQRAVPASFSHYQLPSLPSHEHSVWCRLRIGSKGSVYLERRLWLGHLAVGTTSERSGSTKQWERVAVWLKIIEVTYIHVANVGILCLHTCICIIIIQLQGSSYIPIQHNAMLSKGFPPSLPAFISSAICLCCTIAGWAVHDSCGVHSLCSSACGVLHHTKCWQL